MIVVVMQQDKWQMVARINQCIILLQLNKYIQVSLLSEKLPSTKIE